MVSKHKELLVSLRNGFESLSFGDEDTQMQLRDESLMVIRRAFGPEHEYVVNFRNVGFYPEFYPASRDDELAYWEMGKRRATSLLKTMVRELELDEDTDQQNKEVAAPKSNRVFVVHGHDDEMRLAVARTLERLGLEAVILDERPNRGRTIIEKIERYSNAGFAVVLLSPDDTGYSNTEGADAAQPRARQNVILELGYFAGKLGRENVVALYRGDVELPSDYGGVLYTPYVGDSGSWRSRLVTELKESGYSVSADDL